MKYRFKHHLTKPLCILLCRESRFTMSGAVWYLKRAPDRLSFNTCLKFPVAVVILTTQSESCCQADRGINVNVSFLDIYV